MCQRQLIVDRRNSRMVMRLDMEEARLGGILRRLKELCQAWQIMRTTIQNQYDWRLFESSKNLFENVEQEGQVATWMDDRSGKR